MYGMVLGGLIPSLYLDPLEKWSTIRDIRGSPYEYLMMAHDPREAETPSCNSKLTPAFRPRGSYEFAISRIPRVIWGRP